MSDFLHIERTARKEHTCLACSHPIPKGEKYLRGWETGTRHSFNLCHWCNDYLNECGESEFMAGDHFEARAEAIATAEKEQAEGGGK